MILLHRIEKYRVSILFSCTAMICPVCNEELFRDSDRIEIIRFLLFRLLSGGLSAPSKIYIVFGEIGKMIEKSLYFFNIYPVNI
jgi:hypothetical protein